MDALFVSLIPYLKRCFALERYTRGILFHFHKSFKFQEKEHIISTQIFDGVTQLLYKFKAQPTITFFLLKIYPSAEINLLKVNNRNTRTRCQIYSK